MVFSTYEFVKEFLILYFFICGLERYNKGLRFFGTLSLLPKCVCSYMSCQDMCTSPLEFNTFHYHCTCPSLRQMFQSSSRHDAVDRHCSHPEPLTRDNSKSVCRAGSVTDRKSMNMEACTISSFHKRSDILRFIAEPIWLLRTLCNNFKLLAPSSSSCSFLS